MQRFFIPSPDIQGGILTIEDPRIVFQAGRVLRMRSGDLFTIFDQAGHEREIKIIEIDRRTLIGNVIESLQRDTEPDLKVTLYQAIPKKIALFELVLQKATELGVTDIVPLITERTENRRVGKFERMQTILVEAAEQCGRTHVPTLHHPADFDEILPKLSNGYIAYELEASKSLTDYLEDIKKSKEVQVLIGPEGGFSKKEMELAQKNKIPTFTLGKRILRTETAAISSLSLILL